MTSDEDQFSPPVASDPVEPTAAPVPITSPTAPTKSIRVLAVLVMVAGLILLVAGTATWFVVRGQLADEHIVVSSDADYFAGDDVNGPLTAMSQANVIRDHALEAGGGKTYAELPQDDPARDTVMTASFLRASLFTSVVSFGVALFAAAMGVLMIVIGYALYRLSKLVAPGAVAPAT
jgi:hypothetical protein